uniref:NADH dehydrogenase subunit 5 n=1 Tax=Pseudodiaptomus hessei TaxID=2919416 RepID=UPI002A7F9459|nr:NADH dehydrogenase subunit 5 [Pseudodiaptomus hessei]WOH21592.1 NADH dehydrogenase subunit 5 [Pseudodiaptomus hessei]
MLILIKMMKFNLNITLISSLMLISLSFLGLIMSLFLISSQEIVLEWEVGSINSTKVCFLVVLDFISLFFFSLVSLIAGSVMYFSSSYMMSDTFYSRFILLVISFVLSMWLLIFSPNLISLLLGWDGLGVTSYLLVIFYQSEKSFNAGMITALTNRIGDVCILIIIGFMMSMGTWSYIYFNSSNYFNMSLWLMVVLIIAAMTKSAQIPFSSWLPAAMAAPTPVSALVHSSTLVTAGVYLLVRFNYLIFEFGLDYFVLGLGCLTMFMAGASAMGELDMKKVIALSTLSQLGVMFFALGLSLPAVTFFHLVSHAYFKAMLFMAAGSMIHSMNEYQDIRTMGSSWSLMPLSISVVVVANQSLMGLPFLSGFYSKDLILEMMMMSSFNLLLFIISMMATAFTVIYSMRFVWLVLLSKYMGSSVFTLAEMDKSMLVGMMLLMGPSIVGGMMLSWVVFSYDGLVMLPVWLKLFIIILIMLCLILSYFYYSSEMNLKKESMFKSFIHYMWFMPMMFSLTSTNLGLSSAKMMYKDVDSSWAVNLSFLGLFKSMKFSQLFNNQISSSNFLSGLMMIILLFLII